MSGICRRILVAACKCAVQKCAWSAAGRGRWGASVPVSEKVARGISQRIVGEANLYRLVDEKYIRAPIPAPHSRLCCVASIGGLNHLTWPSLLEKTYHATTSRSSIQPYCKWRSCGTFSRFYEPEECVDRIVGLERRGCKWWKADVPSILLLGRKDGFTGVGRRIIGDNNVAIQGRC